MTGAPPDDGNELPPEAALPPGAEPVAEAPPADALPPPFAEPVPEVAPIENPGEVLPDALSVEPPRRRTLYDRLPAWLRAHLAILATDRVTLYATLAAAVVLTISRYHASTSEYHRLSTEAISKQGGLFAAAFHAIHLPGVAKFVEACTAPIAEYVYWFVGSSLLFYVVPLAFARPFGVRVKDLGAGFGDWRYGLKATALLYGIMLPFVVGASFTATFSSHYPMAGGAATSVRSLVTYELVYASYFIGWEFVYRGLLCNALYPRVGAAVILLHTIPFAVMHAGKPEPEAYGSIIAGLALGVVAVRARSFWYGALLHAAVAFTMDMLALAQTHRFPKSW